MPKKKDTTETTTLLFDENETSTIEETPLTIAEIEEKIRENEEAIKQKENANSAINQELEDISVRRNSRETRIKNQNIALKDAASELESARAHAEIAPLAKAVERAKALNEKQREFDTIQGNLEQLQVDNFNAIQDETVQEKQKRQTFQENSTYIAQLWEATNALMLQYRALHQAEGKTALAQIEQALGQFEEEDRIANENLEAASKAAKSARLKLIKELASAIDTLTPWPELQAKVRSREVYQSTSSERFLESFISHVKLILSEYKDIDNPHTALPVVSIIGNLTIEVGEMHALHEQGASATLQEKLERAESFLEKLKKK